MAMQVSRSTSSRQGRPKAVIDRERVEFLRSLQFNWADISNIIGVSKKTLQRRAREWNIPAYSVISDSDLDALLIRHLQNFPTAGEAMLRGYLTSLNIG